MSLIGITGGIGSGKTFLVKHLIHKGFKVFDSDNISRASYYDKEVFDAIHNIFPNLKNFHGLELRNQLSGFIFKEPEKLRFLESIIHPYVRNKMHKFIDMHKNEDYVFFDIPLLFENNLESNFDKIIVTYCEYETVQQRLLDRGYSLDKISQIISKQLNPCEKKERADIVIDTNGSKSESLIQIENFLKILTGK